MAELDTEGWRRIVRVALVAGLVALKVQVNAGVRDFGIDGSLYFEVARNVRDGRGLVSFVSLMNAGVEHFPYPTPLYPIWPLILGYSGRVVPMELAAVWLPTLFFLGTVLLADRLARRLWPGALFPTVWEVPDRGHLAILMVGYNPLFFEYTSRPYTEGLAFFGLFGLLFRVRRLFDAPSAARGFEVGLWTGLLILVRAQMFLVTLVLVATLGLGLVAWAGRGRWLAVAAAATVGWAVALTPQVAWLSTFYHPLGFDALLRFDAFRASDALQPLVTLRPAPSPLAWLGDRAEGFIVAYRNGGKYAYMQNFGILHWAPVVALALGAARWREALGSARTLVRDPARGADLYLVLLALGGFLSLHTLHKDFGSEWNFALRHALTVLFLFAWGLVALGRRAGPGAFAAVAITAITAWRLGFDMQDVYLDVEKEAASGSTGRPAAARWLAEQRDADPGLVVAGSDVQRLAVAVPGLPLHSVWSDTSGSDLEALSGRLGVKTLVLDRAPEKYAFGTDPGFLSAWEPVADDLSGMSAWRRRAAPPPPESP